VGKDVQFAGVRTSSTDGSDIGFRKTTGTGDSGTRVYIMPSAQVASGVGGAIKIFGDPFWSDPTFALSYRDFGLYFSADQVGDTGSQGTGVFWINSKQGGTDGLFAGKNPDMGFSFQDGATTAGRWQYLPLAVYGGTTRAMLVIGPTASKSASTAVNARLEVQGDIVLDNLTTTANGANPGNKINWWGAASINNFIQFNQVDLTVKVEGKVALKLKAAGGVMLGDNSAEIAAAATTGHLQIPSVPTAPTGNFTAETGHVGLCFCRADSKLYAKVPGSTTWVAGAVFA